MKSYRTPDFGRLHRLDDDAAMSARMHDPSGAKASYWLKRAAMNLDCAVQCCGTLDSHEIDALERRCDELAEKLEEEGL